MYDWSDYTKQTKDLRQRVNSFLYAAPSSFRIAHQKGSNIDKKKLSVADIKNFGEYTAQLKLYQGISAKINVKVQE